MTETIHGVERAARDGTRPAAEETWFCPACGRPAKTFVSFYRLVMCTVCEWVFSVEARHSFDQLRRRYPDRAALDAVVKAQAEQELS